MLSSSVPQVTQVMLPALQNSPAASQHTPTISQNSPSASQNIPIAPQNSPTTSLNSHAASQSPPVVSQNSPTSQNSISSHNLPVLPTSSFVPQPEASTVAPSDSVSNLSGELHCQAQSHQPVGRRSQRTRRPNPRYFNDKFVNVVTVHPLSPSVEPRTVTQVLQDTQWKLAMVEEYDALVRNSTWELVPRADNITVGYKWIFRVKRKPDGSVDRFKARLVAKGFSQEPGRDYYETFSSVVKPVTIRIIFTIALKQGWLLRQLDINNAFLNGTLHEDVYMEQSTGFVQPGLEHHVCRLKKAIYGLKQAPRAWNDDGFINSFICKLAARFSLKDLGVLSHFLGVEVVPTSTGLFLSQGQYVVDILEQFSMAGAKEVSTPMCSSVDLSRQGGDSVDPTLYRKAIGRFVLLARGSVKQRSISRSSTEAEFRALANSAAEVLWIQHLLSELGVVLPSSPELVTDNLSATYVCKNLVFHSRMKHLALDYFFVRERITDGSLCVQHIRSAQQVADLLTKPLGRHLFTYFRDKIGVSDGSSILRGACERIASI
ncbi:PREDICTED: uncharacterized protein LOC109178464 [Ipomoea nil]|uniref:uncharacterized protein LOC109178464 n=1 Tax=Ipomoea nil TaxID=35883 RepID=UPI0009014132|nr:PREDICTED: uncharacterized protein LOC109178464 [Ipomoea nil]